MRPDQQSVYAIAILRIRAMAVALTLSLFANAVAFAAQPRPLDLIKLKQTLMKRGIGMGFKVKELDGTDVTGTLTAIHDDTFEMVAKGTTQAVIIPYSQVSALHNDGNGSGSAGSTAAKIGGGLAIGLGCFAILVVGLSLYAMHGG